MAQALQFLQEQPSERPITAARIYNVNINTLNSHLRRAKARAVPRPHPVKTGRGGQNRILSKAQIEAIYKYVEDSYHAGYGASKSMVFMAIGHLKAAEIPSKPQPTWRWFQTFMKDHPTLFRVIKTKAIARVRVTTHDITTVEGWFTEYKEWCIQHKIEPQNIYNFDESGFRVGVAPGEEVVVPAYVTEVRTYP
jgi:hypothetical protein